MAHPLVVNKRVDGYDVYIGRGSKWGNPYDKWTYGITRSEAIALYRRHLLGSDLLADLHELTGKTLGCYCAPKACHGDVLARMANNPFTVKAYARAAR